MNYLLAMLLADQVAAKLIHFTFMVLTTAAMFSFGRRFFSEMTGLLAAALFATTPIVAWEAATTYVDLALSCYCFLAIVAACYWLRDRQVAWLTLAGLLAGFAVSTKVTALYILAPLGASLALVALIDRGQPWRGRLLPLLRFGVAPQGIVDARAS